MAIRTFGCKANQYDSERMRQALEDAGWDVVEDAAEGDVVVLNTCTVTNRADAQARSWIRRLGREAPHRPVVVAGCSAALHAADYAGRVGAGRVVPGHDPLAVLLAVESGRLGPPPGAPPGPPGGSPLVQIEPLRRRKAGTRGWLKVQDGCDRKCSFCATRLARGMSRSRTPEAVLEEARLLARTHPELVITGIHIGHYGLDLPAGGGARSPTTLASLLAELLDALPEVRFRLGSVEATEVDDALLALMATSGGRVAPHLHMPLQSGADPVLRAMRRWHTRDDYRRRTLEIAEALVAGPTTLTGDPVLGLGADIITGFPGETDADHRETVRLVEELPFTYLHVFPFSPREGTPAAALAREMPVPQRVAGERARELRELGQARGEAYRRRRAGTRARVVVEDGGRSALTGDYLRVAVTGRLPGKDRRLREVELTEVGGELAAVIPPPAPHPGSGAPWWTPGPRSGRADPPG